MQLNIQIFMLLKKCYQPWKEKSQINMTCSTLQLSIFCSLSSVHLQNFSEFKSITLDKHIFN